MRMNRVYSVVILACVLISVSCKQRAEENGWVQFDLYGTTYAINERQFTIRANPLFGDGEKVKTLKKGERINFEFRLGPTEARAKKEIKATGKELEQLADGNIPEGEGISSFDAIWFVETSDPIGSLEKRISYGSPGLNLGAFTLTINVGGDMLIHPDPTHGCWVIIEELTDERVKGRFGGTFELISQDDMGPLGEQVEIDDGVFDAPFKKLFRYR